MASYHSVIMGYAVARFLKFPTAQKDDSIATRAFELLVRSDRTFASIGGTSGEGEENPWVFYPNRRLRKSLSERTAFRYV